MPGRILPLVGGEHYHIFNRGNNRQPTFFKPKDYHRAITTIFFYQHSSPPKKLSYFLSLPKSEQTQSRSSIEGQPKDVEIVAYCLMPNHFHFVLKQISENGISTFMSKFQNSYTKYINAKYKRTGSVFAGQFKAVHIESGEQLLHLTRYLHLNPYSSAIIKNQEEILTYPYSSITDYLNPDGSRLDFTYVNNLRMYRQFVLDQADYQKELENIKHLTIEKMTFEE